ncbi:hypothetical protein COMA2_110130 [Candidatus Nitrospira nitrificans]|uniref:Uncharacterized protein n=1 Tax=Candidatus Nitrospira nitrificans TaxID=1742973 RepID=A0A0S4L8B0_9BACT|nr:hypothetical protein COMA2_110130 [Candidatus Nitrospira nitrificans]
MCALASPHSPYGASADRIGVDKTVETSGGPLGHHGCTEQDLNEKLPREGLIYSSRGMC